MEERSASVVAVRHKEKLTRDKILRLIVALQGLEAVVGDYRCLMKLGDQLIIEHSVKPMSRAVL